MPAPTPLTLLVELGPLHGTVFDSGRLKHVTVGRTKTNRFKIKDETISQKHMSIDWTNDAWMAQDLGSSNGTTVNGVNIGVKTPFRLNNDDLVRIGIDTRIRVIIPGGSMSRQMPTVLQPLAEVKEEEEEQAVLPEAAENVNPFSVSQKPIEAEVKSTEAKFAQEEQAVLPVAVQEEPAVLPVAVQEEPAVLPVGASARTTRRSCRGKLSLAMNKQKTVPLQELAKVKEEIVPFQDLTEISSLRQSTRRKDSAVGTQVSNSKRLKHALELTAERVVDATLLKKAKSAEPTRSYEMSLREWFRQEMLRIPTILDERAEATIREMKVHAEQLKSQLLSARIDCG